MKLKIRTHELTSEFEGRLNYICLNHENLNFNFLIKIKSQFKIGGDIKVIVFSPAAKYVYM